MSSSTTRTYVKSVPTSSATKSKAKSNQKATRQMAITSHRVYTAPTSRTPPSGESNFVDLAPTTYGFNTTGVIALLATIPQGTGVNARIGKRAYYKSLTIRGNAYSGTTASLNHNAMLIIYDKRPTGALPAITDILTSVSPVAFMNDNNSGRFEVIRRIEFVTEGSATAPTGNSLHDISVYVPLKSRPIVFESAGTGAMGDLDSGALYLVCVGTAAAGASNSSSTIAFRTRYSENP